MGRRIVNVLATGTIANTRLLDRTRWCRPPTTIHASGLVKQAIGTVLRASGVGASVGELCWVRNAGGVMVEAEVIGFTPDGVLLMPFGGVDGISVDNDVHPTGHVLKIPVGNHLRGRVLDARGRPLDDKPPLDPSRTVPVHRTAPSPMARRRINQVFPTGIKAMDVGITTGIGQRIGIFAPAGVGKSVLLGMLARNSDSDVNIVALIGERGREVREFVEDSLSAAGLERSVVIVATADAGPIERSTAAYVATAIAESFRDQGQRVLLLIDSITRFARAQREIGLARGEPPTRRGFPPSLFSALPKLFERVGCNETGSITAFYTVLMEDDATPDPVAEEVRSLLDGHIVLSRKLAGQGMYPAIDLTQSLSRLMPSLCDEDHLRAAARVRLLLSKRAEVDLLIKVGEYQRGHDLVSDEAIDRAGQIESLLRQSPTDRVDFQRSRTLLREVTGI
jgi:ATP synthase in type III secretion protein N